MTDHPRWWEPRRDGEPTNDFLARVLDQLGAADVAAKALAYHYDDYLCPPDIDDGANMQRLVAAITDWSRSSTRARRDRAQVLAQAVKNGEFDGTRAESVAWAESADGQETFAELLAGIDPRPSGGRA